MAFEYSAQPFIWPLNRPSILMESLWWLPRSGHNKMFLSCTLDGTPPRGKTSLKQSVIWNKTCCCLMSTPRPHYCKRSLTTGLLPPFISARGRGRKSSGAGLCLKRQHSKCLGSGEENGRRTGVCAPRCIQAPLKRGSQQLPSHNDKTGKTSLPYNCCLSAQFGYCFIVLLPRTIEAPWG